MHLVTKTLPRLRQAFFVSCHSQKTNTFKTSEKVAANQIKKHENFAFSNILHKEKFSTSHVASKEDNDNEGKKHN